MSNREGMDVIRMLNVIPRGSLGAVFPPHEILKVSSAPRILPDPAYT